MGKTSYAIACDGITDGEATFTVTRSQPGTDTDPVMWVHVECDAPVDGPDELPVIWGTNASLTGTASLPVAGTSGTAWATASPWRVKQNDPSIEFTVG